MIVKLQARPGEKHPTLKQLIQKPLLLNRPVLYISLQPWSVLLTPNMAGDYIVI